MYSFFTDPKRICLAKVFKSNKRSVLYQIFVINSFVVNYHCIKDIPLKKSLVKHDHKPSKSASMKNGGIKTQDNESVLKFFAAVEIPLATFITKLKYHRKLLKNKHFPVTQPNTQKQMFMPQGLSWQLTPLAFLYIIPYIIHIRPAYNKAMMMSSNGNIFRVTGPLWGESWGELWFFSAPEQTIKQIIETPVIWDAIAFILTSLLWLQASTEQEQKSWTRFDRWNIKGIM